MSRKCFLDTIIFWALFFACSSTSHPPVDATVLAHYRQFSQNSDPQHYAYLFDTFPRPLDELCAFIKTVLIHPQEAHTMTALFSEARLYQDTADCPTVEKMLAVLCQRNEFKLVPPIAVQNRLVVACYHHSLLMAAVLRQRQIPVRIRTGFARYYEKQTGILFGHIICEVWDAGKGRWMLVDPDRQLVDFSRKKFEFAADAWQKLRCNQIDSQKYLAAMCRGEHAIAHILMQDLSCVIGEEKAYYDEVNGLLEPISGVTDFKPTELALIDRTAELLQKPAVNLNQLIQLHRDHPFLQASGRTFNESFQKME